MRRLILMRHAKSDWRGGETDINRPLNARGRGAATRLGDWLRLQGLVPGEVLCSPATRTRETLARLALGDVPVHFSKPLYLAEPGIVWDTLAMATAQTVLIVGHNPGMAEFARTALADPPETEAFDLYPTGATTVIEFTARSWAETGEGTGVARAFVVPRELP